jgi:type IV fimbrial biogenesis protein FimT
MQKSQKSFGFTLIELMVVLAIVAILTTLAAPSFKSLIQSNTISSAVNTFLGDMRFARSESIRRGGGVVMCRSDAPEAASPTCGTGSGSSSEGWASGWVVYMDQNSNGSIDSGEVLRVQSSLPTVGSISSNPVKNKYQFTGTGRLTGLLSVPTLTFGDPAKFDVGARRKVCINISGRARIAVESNGQTTGNATCGTDQ